MRSFFFFFKYISHIYFFFFFFAVQILFIFGIYVVLFLALSFNVKQLNAKSLNDCHKNDIYSLDKMCVCTLLVTGWVQAAKDVQKLQILLIVQIYTFIFLNRSVVYCVFFCLSFFCLLEFLANFLYAFLLKLKKNKDVEFQF